MAKSPSKMPATMMKKFEKSGMDKKMDSKKGAPKEGSPADTKRDAKALPFFMKKGKK